MEVPTCNPVGVGQLPAQLANGLCFREVSVSVDSEEDYPDDPVVAARQFSPLHGRFLRARARDLQHEAAQLPAARAARRIREAVMKNAVVILEGETGSGKSTQVPQIVLQLFWADMSLLARKVVHVCPLIEPLRGLHKRLEHEMDAVGEIPLMTGRGSECGESGWLMLMTAGVLLHMW